MNPVPLRVLAVDDEPLLAMTLADMIEDLGHRASSVTSGRDALQQMKADVFDVLITDHSMPHMGGTELIAEARGMCPAIKVILATGRSEIPEELGNSVILLSKPFSETDLAKALHEVMA
jgi:CheY-like chemotaxis protein